MRTYFISISRDWLKIYDTENVKKKSPQYKRLQTFSCSFLEFLNWKFQLESICISGPKHVILLCFIIIIYFTSNELQQKDNKR